MTDFDAMAIPDSEWTWSEDMMSNANVDGIIIMVTLFKTIEANHYIFPKSRQRFRLLLMAGHLGLPTKKQLMNGVTLQNWIVTIEGLPCEIALKVKQLYTNTFLTNRCCAVTQTE